jgi:hypothetical protein
MEYTIINALRVAADIYEQDAKATHGLGATSARMAAQFERQAKQARELAEKIEAHGLRVTLSDAG